MHLSLYCIATSMPLGLLARSERIQDDGHINRFLEQGTDGGWDQPEAGDYHQAET